jgi:hypothetical protein
MTSLTLTVPLVFHLSYEYLYKYINIRSQAQNNLGVDTISLYQSDRSNKYDMFSIKILSNRNIFLRSTTTSIHKGTRQATPSEEVPLRPSAPATDGVFFPAAGDAIVSTGKWRWPQIPSDMWRGSISCANPTPSANFANPNYNHPMPIQRLEKEMRLINT